MINMCHKGLGVFHSTQFFLLLDSTLTRILTQSSPPPLKAELFMCAHYQGFILTPCHQRLVSEQRSLAHLPQAASITTETNKP